MAAIHHSGSQRKYASVSKVTEMPRKSRAAAERGGGGGGGGGIPVSQSLTPQHITYSRESFAAPDLPRSRGDSVTYQLFHARRRSRRLTMAAELQGELITQSRRHSILARAGTTLEGEVGEKDKRTRSNLIKSLRKQHSEQLYKKFRLVAKMAVICIQMVKSHNLRNKLYDEIAPYINSLHFYDYDMPVEGIDLMFDPSIYKADKQLKMTDEAIRILRTRPEDRTDKELYYVQLCLRNIKSFSEYPMRMQRRIIQVGQYERYEAKRMIVRQGKPACAFYFILSGSVVIMVSEGNTKVAKPVAYMSKGTAFGELAIINRTDRQATVVAKSTLELLSIDIEDFHRIFMAGGVKNINDPDHDDFIRSLNFLKGWPVKILPESPKKCIFHYFKRGAILVQDSNYSDWLYVVKSGSMQVLKKLKRVTPYEAARRAKNPPKKFRTEKEKREEKELRRKQRRFILPDINIGTRDTADVDAQAKQSLEELIDLPEIYQVSSANKDNIPLIQLDENYDSSNDNGHLPHISSSESECSNGAHGGSVNGDSEFRRDSNSSSLPLTDSTSALGSSSNDLSPSQTRRPSAASLRGPHVRKRGRKKKAVKTKDHEEFETDIHRKQELRTITDDFDAKFRTKKAEELTEADKDPQFVHVQTLTKGQVFGISQLILGDQPSFCVVSSGVEVIMIDKQYYRQHAPEDLLRRLKQESCPYPTDEDLQDDLQIAIDWDAYKTSTFKKTLRYLGVQKSPRFASW